MSSSRNLINNLEAYDTSFALNVSAILKVHEHFIGIGSRMALEKCLTLEIMHKLNALLGAFSFLSWPCKEKYFDSKDVEDVLNRYSSMYGERSEFLNLILNRFRLSNVLGEYFHTTFLKKYLLELEHTFSLVAFQALVLDQIQQFHIFLASLNGERKMMKQIQTEILQRNEDLHLFYQKSENELKTLIGATLDNLPKITMN